MKPTFFRSAAMILVALLLSMAAQARSLQNGDLPGWTQWYAHINLAQFHNSEVGQILLREMDIEEAMEDVRRETGIDVSSQVNAVTVLGSNADGEPHAVVVHGNISQDSIDQLANKAQEIGQMATSTYRGVEVYTVHKGYSHESSDGDTRVQIDSDDSFHAVFGDSSSLFTKHMDVVEEFINGGLDLSGFDPGSPELIVIEAERAMLQGGLSNADNHHNPWNSSVLKNIDRISAAMIDQDGDVLLTAQVQTVSPEIAQSVIGVVQGIVALKALDAADEPLLTELSEQLQISGDGALVNIDLLVEKDQLTEMID